MKEAGEAANILARNGEREGIRAQEGWSLFFRKRNAYMFGIGDPWQGHRDESNRSCFFFFFCILNQDLWGGGYIMEKAPTCMVLTYTRGREKVWYVIFFCLYFLVISQLNFSMSLIFFKCSDAKNNSLKI